MGVFDFIQTALNPPHQVSVSLTSKSFWEGSAVDGEINVTCAQCPLPAEIIVKIKGIAKGQIARNNEVRVHKPVFCETIAVFKGELKEKEQFFPFRFYLPKECPGSFWISTSDGFRKDTAGVAYYIKATLKVSEHFDQKVRKSFEVLERQKKIATPARTLAFHYSDIGIDVWTDRNTYFPGDVVILRLKICNNFKDIKCTIQMRLAQTVQFNKMGVYLFGQPYVRHIASPPFLYYGTMWVAFKIPNNTKLSTSNGPINLLYFLEFDINNDYKLKLPLYILAPQELETLHPKVPEGALLPPPAIIRPPLQPDDEAPNCNLCGVGFTMKKRRTHCRHCGKVFCADCTNSKTAIKKMRHVNPVKVCRTCMRIVEETGGVKYQNPKKEIEEWRKSPEVQWVPKCSKRDYEWEPAKFVSENSECYTAVREI
eukprot:Phypoly_transcript_06100.p1 GENE.Phypoly_transcript_06100~~Phypoly_transcript_06100.p1  ORF type:complete len:426 (+),score=67.90 Phypoly_transcript_06100:71-1348(+)